MNTLDRLFRERQPTQTPESQERAGDIALLDSDWDNAINNYRKCDDSEARIAEKLGFALALNGDFPDALHTLQPIEAALSSGGLAALAVSYVGGWGRLVKEEYRERLSSILEQSLSTDPPHWLAYEAKLRLADYRDDPNEIIQVATHALTHFPKWNFVRAKLASWMHRAGHDPVRILGVLQDGEVAHAPSSYHWQIAQTAVLCKQWDLALIEFEKSKKSTSFDHSPETIYSIEVIKARTLREQGSFAQARQAYQNIIQSQSDPAKKIACLVSVLEICCETADQEGMRAAATDWLGLIDRHHFSALDVFGSEQTPVYFADSGDCHVLDGNAQPIAFKTTILDALPQDQRGTARWLFAREARRSSDDFDQSSFVEEMLTASSETENVIFGADLAYALVIQKQRAWARAARAWTRYEIARHAADGPDWLDDEPLQLVEKITDKDVQAYAKAMLEELANTTKEIAADIFDRSLRACLKERKLYKQWKDFAIFLADDSDVDTQFDAALASHFCQDRSTAERHYWRVLELEPSNEATLFNLLLFAQSERDAPLLQRIANRISDLPPSDSEYRVELETELQRAQVRCRNPNEVKREAITAELRKYDSNCNKPR